jgi:hypothetical protein
LNRCIDLGKRCFCRSAACDQDNVPARRNPWQAMAHRFTHQTLDPVAHSRLAYGLTHYKTKTANVHSVCTCAQDNERVRPRLAFVPNALKIRAAAQTEGTIHLVCSPTISVSGSSGWEIRSVACARVTGAPPRLCVHLWFSCGCESRACVFVSSVWVDKLFSLVLLDVLRWESKLRIPRDILMLSLTQHCCVLERDRQAVGG